MKLADLINNIHQNAIAHGWWEGKRSLPEIIALIHSEWSEALEEARAGRPLVYYDCVLCPDGPCQMTKEDEAASICDYSDAEAKPEGIAVEIIDGCIRIFDFMGSEQLFNPFCIMIGDTPVSDVEELYKGMSEITYTEFSSLIADLHSFTSLAYDAFMDGEKEDGWTWITETLIAALSWVKAKGLDPLHVLLEKHEYNKTRPYKHGKQF